MDLTEKQSDILDFVRAYAAEHGRAPTVREIRAALGISSTSVVAYSLRRLQRAGLIHVEDGLSRGVRLSGQRMVFPGDPVRVRVGEQVFDAELVA